MRLDQLLIETDHTERMVIDALIEIETGMSCDEGVKVLSDDEIRAIVEKARSQIRKPIQKELAAVMYT